MECTIARNNRKVFIHFFSGVRAPDLRFDEAKSQIPGFEFPADSSFWGWWDGVGKFFYLYGRKKLDVGGHYTCYRACISTISLLIRFWGDSWSYVVQLRTQKHHWNGAWGPSKWGPDRISGGVIYLSGVVFQVILWRLYWMALWNWPHAIYSLRIVGYGHELWRPDVFNILPDMNPFRNSNGILGCIIESNEARNGIIEKVWNESHFSKEISWLLFYK